MTDKVYYQTAASEVAGGQLDQALWIKVGAEMPGADNVARQAKYIQLRAQELARDTMKSCAATWLRRTKKIVLVLVGLMLLVALAGALFDWVFPQHYSAPQTRDSSPYGY